MKPQLLFAGMRKEQQGRKTNLLNGKNYRRCILIIICCRTLKFRSNPAEKEAGALNTLDFQGKGVKCRHPSHISLPFI